MAITLGMGQAPAAPAPTRVDETYLGDNIYGMCDGQRLWMRTPLGLVALSMPGVEALHQLTQTMLRREPLGDHSVWCEETKKHYRAVLIRELTLDEVYSGLK